MIITDEFVMLNMPKTGSSFARHAIREIYSNCNPKRPCQELLVHQIDRQFAHKSPGQHGTRRQIPAAHRHKPIVTIRRQPEQRYLSGYLFRHWARELPANLDEIVESRLIISAFIKQFRCLFLPLLQCL
ncbi:MAG: hypothetical protein H7842_15775, partial [Gammaproteobacteria bacterium SHHR-1]